MKNETELNIKLAKWRFPNAENIIIESGISIYHNERKEPNYPWHTHLFTQSLDACFKWLVPKIIEGVDNDSIEVSILCPTTECIFWVVQITNRCSTLSGSNAKTPSLALCLAIEKVIDRKSA